MQASGRLDKWGCPHHDFKACGRKAQAAGDLLFRCDTCPDAFCEDCLPESHEMVGENELFLSLGQPHPLQACFITCCETCKDDKKTSAPFVKRHMKAAEKRLAALEAGRG